MSDVEISVVRMPSLVGIAMEVAPLVRLGYITDAEGSWLVDHRYKLKAIELERESEHDA